MRSLGSDNNSGVHPQGMDAFLCANAGDALAYGDDEWTQRDILMLQRALRDVSEKFLIKDCCYVRDDNPLEIKLVTSNATVRDLENFVNDFSDVIFSRGNQ